MAGSSPAMTSELVALPSHACPTIPRVPTGTRFSEIAGVPIEQRNAAVQDGLADGPKTDKARAFKPRLLQKDKGEYAQDKYTGDHSISDTVGHAHCVRRSDDFRHVRNLFNETMRRHTSHSRKMQVVTSKIK
jgi:hypothetical protein